MLVSDPLWLDGLAPAFVLLVNYFDGRLSRRNFFGRLLAAEFTAHAATAFTTARDSQTLRLSTLGSMTCAAIHRNNPAQIAYGILRSQKLVWISRAIRSTDGPCLPSWSWIGTCMVTVETQTTVCAATAAHTAQPGIAAGRDQNMRVVNAVPRSSGATKNVSTLGEMN